jgi:TolB protein
MNDIYIMDSDGGNVRRLTNHPAFDYDSPWSPDGRRIAFTSTRDGRSQIYVMDADGGNVQRLTNSPADDWQPTWAR